MRFIKILFLISILILSSDITEAAPSSFETTFDQKGYFGYDVDGQGLSSWVWNGWRYGPGPSSPAGTISLDLQGTPVYGVNYWHGFDETGNPNVMLNGTAISGTELAEAPGGEYGLGYYAEVTGLLSEGLNDYTISNVAFDGNTNGFGMIGVYEDASQSQYGRMIIANGNDRAYVGSRGNNGPNTDVLSLDVDAVDYDREVDVTFIVGGGEDGIRFDDRRSYVWYYTGEDGAVPVNLVDESFATQHPDKNPIFARDGYDWDTYRMSILLPANQSVLALQIESDDEYPHGESFNWLSAAVFVPEDPAVIPEPTSLLLLSMGLSGLALRRKTKKI